MERIKRWIASIFLQRRFFIVLVILVGTFVGAFLFPLILSLAKIGTIILTALLLMDLFMLYVPRNAVDAHRITPDRFSNGDKNPVSLHFDNQYNFSIQARVIDEAPIQFQLRDQQFYLKMAARSSDQRAYALRPVSRGEYHFGRLMVYVSGPIGLVARRFAFDADAMVPTYPSYLQMRKYQFMAISNRLTDIGVKKIRRLGHTTEFEQIKEYVRGDDFRTVNWKATARSGKLMVNQYVDERAQHIYCLIDQSRAMKMPFEGMSLLDYAINATLVMLNIAIYRQDKGGLIAFAEKIQARVPASSKLTQMNRILEVLYNQKTAFKEADYERLYIFLKRRIPQRSLLLLFSNFESLTSLRRQLPYLQRIAKSHLLVVIFFENTELTDLLASNPKNTEEIYIKTIGEQFAYEKRLIARELEQHGIMTILSPPDMLTVNTINKYLEIKSRGMV